MLPLVDLPASVTVVEVQRDMRRSPTGCMIWYGMVWQKPVEDSWQPKRPDLALDRDGVTRQTLWARIHAAPPAVNTHGQRLISV